MNRLTILAVFIVGLFIMAACSNPADDKSKAKTGEKVAVSSPAAAGEKYAINPQNSKIEFIGSKVTGSHNGSFQLFSGTIDYAGAIEKSQVKIAIDMSSVNVDDPGLTKHLKTPDFFDVEKFPRASFVSTEIKAGGEKGASHTVTGNLEMHGVTKSITFPATITASASGVNVDSTFSINRKDFGINYAGAADNLIRDEVVLKLTVRATK